MLKSISVKQRFSEHAGSASYELLTSSRHTHGHSPTLLQIPIQSRTCVQGFMFPLQLENVKFWGSGCTIPKYFKWVRTALMSIPALYCFSQLLDLRAEMRAYEKSYHSVFSFHLLPYNTEYQSILWAIWCLYLHSTFLWKTSIVIPHLILYKSSDPGYLGPYLQNVLKSLLLSRHLLLQ